MPAEDKNSSSRDQLTTIWVDLTIRLAVLAALLYWSFVLLLPFIGIAIWSVVLTVALYPVYDWVVVRLGGRRRLAAAVLTLFNLLVVIGPATWLALGLIDSLRTLSSHLDFSVLALPPPPMTVKSWPLIGERIYEFWDLASTNIEEAFAKIAPHLKPLGGVLVQITAGASAGTIKFFVAIIVAGFLFAPAPALVESFRSLSRTVAAEHGMKFVTTAGATIRAISRGVIGISALQAILAGVGLVIFGVPGASLITSAVLILGIMQIGPSIVLIPRIIWSWVTMETTTALLFTAYMIPVGLLDNVLRPLVIGRGLDTPMLVILIGVIGGTISYGITGLFLGPIVLAVLWDLILAWIRDHEDAERDQVSPRTDQASE